jgi:hypothetical protein
MKNNVIIGLLSIILLWLLYVTLRPAPDMSEIDRKIDSLHVEQLRILTEIQSWEVPQPEEINNHYTNIIKENENIIKAHSVSDDILYFQSWQYSD